MQDLAKYLAHNRRSINVTSLTALKCYIFKALHNIKASNHISEYHPSSKNKCQRKFQSIYVMLNTASRHLPFAHIFLFCISCSTFQGHDLSATGSATWILLRKVLTKLNKQTSMVLTAGSYCISTRPHLNAVESQQVPPSIRQEGHSPTC